MIRPVVALYQVVVNPLNFVKFYCYQSPLKLGFLVIGLVSFAKLPAWTEGDSSWITTWLMLALGYTIFLGLQAMTTDFFAQMLHLHGKSLSLFAWLGISLLPLTCHPLLYLLQVSAPFPMVWSGLANMLGFCVIAWQIYMIKHIYNSSIRKSVLLYVLPLLVLGMIAWFIALVGGALFSFYG